MAGLCYVGTQLDQPGIQAIQGALFIFVTENTFSPMYSVLALFPQDFPLFMREYKSGLYGVGVYYLSKLFAMVRNFKNILHGHFLSSNLFAVARIDN
jgi:ATP-binding cassette, subfamily G (WHITE), eye pigment precursor transporter